MTGILIILVIIRFRYIQIFRKIKYCIFFYKTLFGTYITVYDSLSSLDNYILIYI